MAEAAVRTGRKYLGCDIDPVAVEQTRQRIKEVTDKIVRGELHLDRDYKDVKAKYVNGLFIHASEKAKAAGRRSGGPTLETEGLIDNYREDLRDIEELVVHPVDASAAAGALTVMTPNLPKNKRPAGVALASANKRVNQG